MMRAWISLVFGLMACLPAAAAGQTPTQTPPSVEPAPTWRLATEFVDATLGGDELREAWVRRYVNPDSLRRRDRTSWLQVMDSIGASAPDLTLTGIREHGPWLDLLVAVGPDRRLREISLRRSMDAPGEIADIFAAPWPLSWPAAGASAGEASVADAVRARIEFAARHDDFSGAALVVHDGQQAYRGALGFADRKAGRANAPEGRFILASAGKMFTTVAIARLIEDGRLTLDTPLGEVLPDYPNPVARRATIRQILSHSAGFGDFFDRPGVLGRGFTSAAEALPFFAEAPLQFEPGTAAHYSNEGFVVLGAVVERLTGQTYYDWVHAHIFRPLHMNDTGFASAGRPDLGLPVGYVFAEADDLGLGPRQPVEAPPEGRGFRGGPAGGAFSTVDDMSAFLAALVDGRLIRRQTLETLLTPEPNGEQGYALGFEIAVRNGRTLFGHSGGSTEGVDTRIFALPDSGDRYILLGNYAPPVGQPLGDDLADILTRPEP